MIHNAMASASSCEHTTCRRMRRMMSRSNESPSTGSGHGSTIQWSCKGAMTFSPRRASSSSSIASCDTPSRLAALLAFSGELDTRAQLRASARALLLVGLRPSLSRVSLGCRCLVDRPGSAAANPALASMKLVQLLARAAGSLPTQQCRPSAADQAARARGSRRQCLAAKRRRHSYVPGRRHHCRARSPPWRRAGMPHARRAISSHRRRSTSPGYSRTATGRPWPRPRRRGWYAPRRSPRSVPAAGRAAPVRRRRSTASRPGLSGSGRL